MIPESPYAEAAVLASMILESRFIPKYTEYLTEDDFFRDEHKILFRAIKEIGSDVDLIRIRDWIDSHKLRESLSVDYLVKVVESVASTVSIDHYAKIVRRKTCERKLVQLTDSDDPIQLVGSVKAEIESLRTEKCPHVSEFIDEVTDIPCDYLTTGFIQLDDLIVGWRTGVYILAAASSMGKTGLMLDFVKHRLVEGDRVLVVSLEMTRRQLLVRVVGSLAKIDTRKIDRGLANEADIETAKAGIKLSDLYVYDKSTITVGQISAIIEEVSPNIVFIDYMGLITYSDSKHNDYQGISAISRSVKAISKDFGVPLIVLHQVNRGVSGRTDTKPRMSDLRDSGKIEQDADVVMLLHREDYYKKNEPDYTPNDEADLIIAKARNGQTGSIKLLFAPWWVSFKEKV